MSERWGRFLDVTEADLAIGLVATSNGTCGCCHGELARGELAVTSPHRLSELWHRVCFERWARRRPVPPGAVGALSASQTEPWAIVPSPTPSALSSAGSSDA